MSEIEQAQVLTGKDFKPPSYLYYGPPGSGKTFLSLHQAGKKFLIDADNKAHEMQNLSPEVCANVTVWSCPDTVPGGMIDVVNRTTKVTTDPQGLRRIVNVINELVGLARKSARDNEPFPFDICILDSWSAVNDHAFDKVKFDQGKGPKFSWDEWGLMYNNNLAVLKGFLQLPCKRIVIAHDVHKTIRDPETQEVKQEYIRPAIAGQLSETFAKYFTEVWYFRGRTRTGDYKIQTVTDELLVARSASIAAPEVLISKETKNLVIR